MRGVIAKRTMHGLTRTPTYRSWQHMIRRCFDKKHNRYEIYGGRGIKVCERWLEFMNFLSDMGIRPEGMSLDRINNDADYKPENCRWATPKQQTNNRHISLANEESLFKQGLRKCRKCLLIKNLDNFWKSESQLPKDNTNTLTICKACNNKRRREWEAGRASK